METGSTTEGEAAPLGMKRPAIDGFDIRLRCPTVTLLGLNSTQCALENMCSQIEDQTANSTNLDTLLAMSSKLVDTYNEACVTESLAMLPSFMSKFLAGNESGVFLSIDVGGSTLRAALVEVTGTTSEGRVQPQIYGIRTWEISPSIKGLSGTAFLGWIAGNIACMLNEIEAQRHESGQSALPLLSTINGRLATGLSWSFPLRQTDVHKGLVLTSGKGFLALDELVGQEINILIDKALEKAGIDISLEAIVNDTIAGLLAHNYRDPAGSISVVLGTGCNAAIELPIKALGARRLNHYPMSWLTGSDKVLVNTELSLFGGSILKTTVWDDVISRQGFTTCSQPFEYLCGGYYLGEIVRIILLDAVESAGLFDGHKPANLEKAFSLPTDVAATFENDSSPTLEVTRLIFETQYPLCCQYEARLSDLKFIKNVTRMITCRAAAYFAVGIYSLHRFAKVSLGAAEYGRKGASVGFTGAVLEKYPGFLETCQKYLTSMTLGDKYHGGNIVLKHNANSTIIGAALAAASAVQDRNNAS